MIPPLSPQHQDHILETAIRLALDNFVLARHVAGFLVEYESQGLPPPCATLLLRGAGPEAQLPGENCGFATTPIIQQAILDCRRTLEFFGITRDARLDTLKPATNRQIDDLSIEHFGLPVVTPKSFLDELADVTSEPLEPLLVEVIRWSNKKLAHFTVSEDEVTFRAIDVGSNAMIQAFFRFLYDASGRERPSAVLKR